MALFSKNSKTKTKAKPAAAGLPAQPVSTGTRQRDLSWVLKKPHITEKSTDVQAARAYVFLVDPRANTRDVASAIQSVYKVIPTRVNMVNMRRKVIHNVRTGKTGVKGGGKKAYVYLKEGDSINLV